MADVSLERLHQLRDTKLQDINDDELVELKSVVVDKTRPVPERVADFIEKIRNPYCFKVDGVVVKLKFTVNGGSCQDAFYSMANAMR